MMKKTMLLQFVVWCVWAVQGLAAERPNVVFILSDDVGYGDLGCYGANCVRTPHLDGLAKAGTLFRDAHSTAAVCTPTRFALMTGRYAWRHRGTGIAPGDAALLIPRDKPTLAGALKSAGYATGVVGKWHLGLGEGRPDFNGEIRPGPLEVGFDYAFYIPATGDRVPCVFVENHRVVGADPADPISVSYGSRIGSEPTGLERPDLLKIKADPQHSQTIVNGISRIGYMTGGKAALWKDEDMADRLTEKAVGFIERQSAEKPFFLYLATHDIHEPMVPHPRFRGTSQCGWRGDVIHQLDWTVGEVLAALERKGFGRNTIVIFSSDNGGAIKSTYDDGTNELHKLQPPNGSLRGMKGSLYEGGHRVPFLVRWPGHVPEGKVSEALVALVDLPATLCAVAGKALKEGEFADSVDVMPAWLGKPGANGREQLVVQGNNQAPLALRKGAWKLVQKNRSQSELYDLNGDLAETSELSKTHPEKLRELSALLEAEIAKGRE
ncbi:MAG: Arylsulfatase [Verrucomicrobiota bacterium]